MDIVVFVALLIPSIILHEVAHGWAALQLGDGTAKEQGRLTLNPLAHIDPVGSLLLPIITAAAGFGAFGYAKPVPVNTRRLRRPRDHAVLVSLAGPATNLAIVAVAAVVIRLNGGVTPPGLGSVDWTFSMVVYALGFINVLLALFNLLPIPPLDGSAVVERLLPVAWLPRWHRIRRYSIVLVLALVVALRLVSDADTALVDPVLDLWDSITGVR